VGNALKITGIVLAVAGAAWTAYTVWKASGKTEEDNATLDSN